MTNEIAVPANEFGIVRVFQLSDTLARELARAPALTPLAQALGLETLNADHVQVAALDSLDDLGLTGLLEQGHGVAPATLAPDAQRLAGLTGTAAILRSRAFDGTGLALHPTADCTLIATYAEDGAPPPHLEPLHSTGSAGILDGGPKGIPPDYRASRRTLMIGLVLSVLLALIVLAISRSAA